MVGTMASTSYGCRLEVCGQNGYITPAVLPQRPARGGNQKGLFNPAVVGARMEAKWLHNPAVLGVPCTPRPCNLMTLHHPARAQDSLVDCCAIY